MQLLPHHLSCERGRWQAFRRRRQQKNYLALEKKALTRDKYTCRYCGFNSKRYQTVVSLDNTYQDQNPSLQQLATCCSICALGFFIDNPNLDGVIIYLPEISQAQLNHLCRALFTSLEKNPPYKSKLLELYLNLKDRCQVTEKLFGPDTSKSASFGQALIDSNISLEQQDHPLIRQLRFLPSKKLIEKQIPYWRDNIFKNLPL